MNKKPRYQNFIDEQKAGMVHGVFIDDTGSPGLRETPSNLNPNRKSWVAVIVPKYQIAEVWKQFAAVISELRLQTGATEFHFTDIYMGRGAFNGIELSKRIGIFRFMAHIFGTYKFPVFVQTLDPDILNDIRGRMSFPNHLGPFNFSKHQDVALFFLLIRVKWYLESNYTGTEKIARVFIDEGFQKNGAAIVIPPLSEVFADGMLCFGCSKSIFPIQLADFAAYCLNRTQLLLGRTSLSELDKQLLQIIQPLMWNYQNIPQIPLDSWFPKNEPTYH